MSRIDTFWHLFRNDRKLFDRAIANKISHSNIARIIPDKLYLKLLYRLFMGKKLNLSNPQGLNEKLQWLKLYDRNPRYPELVDKYEVKNYVKDIIGNEYIIPTFGIWNTADEIDVNELPDQFVLKCTHDSGSVQICKDKKEFTDNISQIKTKLDKALRRNMFYYGREWPYKNVKPRIIAEKYLESNEGDIRINDYKFYIFNGTFKFVMINSDRGRNTTADYFNRDYQWMDFTWGYPHAKVRPKKPVNFELMIELGEKLANGIPEVRVDFYEVNGHVYFGEMTFFDGSGFDSIEPGSWDLKIGEWLKLEGI